MTTPAFYRLTIETKHRERERAAVALSEATETCRRDPSADARRKCLLARQRWDRLRQETDKAAALACAEFARERGWKRARWFTLDELRRGIRRGQHFDSEQQVSVIDHAEYFKIGRHPVAILSHSYEQRERIEEYATECGLTTEYLPFSWYYPGACTAVLFMRPLPLHDELLGRVAVQEAP